MKKTIFVIIGIVLTLLIALVVVNKVSDSRVDTSNKKFDEFTTEETTEALIEDDTDDINVDTNDASSVDDTNSAINETEETVVEGEKVYDSVLLTEDIAKEKLSENYNNVEIYTLSGNEESSYVVFESDNKYYLADFDSKFNITNVEEISYEDARSIN